MMMLKRKAGSGVSTTRFLLIFVFGPTFAIAILAHIFVGPHVITVGEAMELVDRVPSQVWPLYTLIFPFAWAKGAYEAKVQNGK